MSFTLSRDFNNATTTFDITNIIVTNQFYMYTSRNQLISFTALRGESSSKDIKHYRLPFALYRVIQIWYSIFPHTKASIDNFFKLKQRFFAATEKSVRSSVRRAENNPVFL